MKSREDPTWSMSTFSSARLRRRMHSSASEVLSSRSKILMVSLGPNVGAAMSYTCDYSFVALTARTRWSRTVLANRPLATIGVLLLFSQGAGRYGRARIDRFHQP